MENSICLDSDILINFLRNKEEIVRWIKENEDKCEFAMTIINLFELYSGAYYSRDEKKVLAVKELASKLKILNFTLKSAEESGMEDARLRKKGLVIDRRDLFVGVIAKTEGFSLKTNNKRHFLRINGLRII